MNQLRRFMYGRYGFDQYTRMLIILSLVLSFTAAITSIGPLLWVSYIPFLYAIFRILSKNVAARSKENYIYCQMTGSAANWFKHIKLMLFGTKTHKYYKCTSCRQTIRVPRGKGKICITCPKCRTEFVRRT